MSGEYGGCDNIWAFPNIFYDFSDKRPSVVMKKNNFIIFAHIPTVFLAMHSNELIVVAQQGEF